jgi:hypothetical protein
MLAGGAGSGLTAAFDAVLADLAKAQGRLARERERADRLVAQRDELRARLAADQARREPGVLTRLRRVVPL